MQKRNPSTESPRSMETRTGNEGSRCLEKVPLNRLSLREDWGRGGEGGSVLNYDVINAIILITSGQTILL